MKNLICFRVLLCLLVCGCLLLCACREEVETSTVSSQPEDTKLSQMQTALGKGHEFLSQTETLFGTPVFSALATLQGNGIYTQRLTLDSLSVLGTGYIGTDPLILLREKTHIEGKSHTVGTLSAAGDTIHFVRDDTPEGHYLAFPQANGTGFALTDALGTSSAVLFGKGSLQLRDALTSILTEEQITATTHDEKTEYTAVLGGDFISRLQAVFGSALPLSNDSSTACTVTIMSGDGYYEQKMVIRQEELLLLQTSYTLEKKGSTLSFCAEILQDGTPLLAVTGSVSTTRRTMTVEANLLERDAHTQLSLTFRSESAHTATVQGTLFITRSDENARIAEIPLELTGTMCIAEEQIQLSASVGASVAGVLSLSMTTEGTFTPEKVQLPQAMDGTNLPEGDMDAIVDGLRQKYPHAAALYDGLFRYTEGSPEDISSSTYRDETGSLVLTLYSDGTVGLSLTGSYTLEAETLSLTYKENVLFSVPCIPNENGTYSIWNTTFAYYAETYSYLSAGGMHWIELMANAGGTELALLDLCMPVTATENILEILMPDGSILPLPYQATQDGLTAWLWDIELKLVSGNSP